MTTSDPPAQRGLLLLLATAAGTAAANLYYAQPLAGEMARSLGVSEGEIGVALVASQLGYALGMLLLVPLGDGVERRRLIVATGGAATVSALLVAASPGASLVAFASLLLGVSSSLAQMIVPFAVALARPELRARAIGTVMSGLLTGILLSRVASGALGEWIGWRATFVVAAIVMAATTAMLRWKLPLQRPESPMRWGAILRSLAEIVRTEPLLRRHALLGATGFAAFSAFWSTLSFQLATLGHGSDVAGAFGAIGIVGVVVAPVVGRLSGRVPQGAFNVAGLALVSASFMLLGAGASSLVAIAIAVVLLDAGMQASHLANQAVILDRAPDRRNRINALYMVSNFAGGALGTALAAIAWSQWGWAGVCAVGIAIPLIGVLRALGAMLNGRR